MDQDDDSASGDQGPPTKVGLRLDLLIRSVENVATSIGTLYLYRMIVPDYEVLGRLSETDAADRVRTFLPCIASLVKTTGVKDERQPLSLDDVNRLTDSDVEKVAEAYTATLLRLGGDARYGEESQRNADETAASYLDRILKHELNVYLKQQRETLDKLLAPNSSLFDQVRKSSLALESTLREFDRLQKYTATDTYLKNWTPSPVVSDHFAQQVRERNEELEMVRLTGRMTAESAKTLKDLADAATVLLERWDERDKRATESTRTQISIAVWSVGITAFLALVAVIFSSLTYFQDKHSTESENEWQVTLLQAVQEGNQRQIAVEQDNQNLRTQIHELGTEIARLATDIHTLGTRSFIPTNEATE